MVVTVDLETHDDDWDMTDAAIGDSDDAQLARVYLLPPDELREWQLSAKPQMRHPPYTAFDTMQWCVF